MLIRPAFRRRASALVMPSYLDSGAGAVEAGGDGTFNVPFPATVAPGNFMVLHVVAQSTSVLPSPAPGGSWAAGPTNNQAAVFAGAWAFYLPSALGTEGGTNLSLVCTDADNFAQARIHRFSHGSGIEASGSAVTGGSGTAVNAVDLTTLGPNRLALQLFSCSGASIAMGDIGSTGEVTYAEAVAEYFGSFNQQLQTAQVANAVAITGGGITLGSARTTKIRLAFAITP